MLIGLLIVANTHQYRGRSRGHGCNAAIADLRPYLALCGDLRGGDRAPRSVPALRPLRLGAALAHFLSLFAYVGTVFAVGVPWMTVARDLVLPHLEFSGSYLTVVVAIFGTTISPYLFFWQTDEEVEGEKENPAARPLVEAPRQAPQALARIQLDTLVGMGFSNIIALFIMLTTAATLNAHGVKDIQTSSQAAEASRPIAGDFAFAIFALGIIPAQDCSPCRCSPESAAYAVGEALQWQVGLAQHPGRAKAFYGVIAAATLVGAVLNFTPLRSDQGSVLERRHQRRRGSADHGDDHAAQVPSKGHVQPIHAGSVAQGPGLARYGRDGRRRGRHVRDLGE